MTKFTLSRKPQLSAVQLAAKKHLKTHLKRIRNKEYSRLRDMVPAIANKQKVSKVTVIEEAVRYIDELHRALASRLINSEISHITADQEVIKDLVHGFIPTDFYERRKQIQAQLNTENRQRAPSHLQIDRKLTPKQF